MNQVAKEKNTSEISFGSSMLLFGWVFAGFQPLKKRSHKKLRQNFPLDPKTMKNEGSKPQIYGL